MNKILFLGILIIVIFAICSVISIAANCGGATVCNCADSLNESRTLNASDNLTGCTANGLVITQNNVELDCSGYNISGNSNGVGSGVYINSGLNNITVTNCTIFGFTVSSDESGIYDNSGTNHTLTYNTIYDNGYGIYSLANSIIKFNSINNSQAAGVDVEGSYSAVIANNTITYSTAFTNSPGIYISTAAAVNITNNTIHSNKRGIQLATATNTKIWHNNIYNNTLLEIFSSSAFEASYNNEGNYWGRNSCPVFIAGTDSNSATVKDSYAYNAFNGWLTESPADCTNPVADFGTNPIDNYNSSSENITFELKCSDDIAVDVLQLWGNWSGWHANQTNSSPINNTIWFVTVYNISEGTWKWGVYCNDSSGNIDWSDTNRTFTVDTTGPTVIIQSPTTGPHTTTTLDLKVIADEPIDTWWYSLNRGPNTTFTPNITITAAQGVNNITVYANDTLGNMGLASSYQQIFIVDSLAPTVAIVSPSSIGYSADFIVNATIEDNYAGISEVYYRWENSTENGTWISMTNTSANSWNATFGISAVGNGSFTFRINTTDAYNNSNTAETITGVIIDTVNPSISSFSCSDITAGSSQSCSCTATDNSESFGGSVTTSITSADTDTTGTKSVTCTATDNTGNTATSTVSYTVSRAGGGGGVTPSTKTWDTESTDSVTYKLGTTDTVKFKIEEEEHRARVYSIYSNYVTIKFNSETFYLDVYLGELSKVDLNKDFVYDLIVQLNSIINKKADITFTKISEEYGPEVAEEIEVIEPEEEIIEEEIQPEPEVLPEPAEILEEQELQKQKTKNWMWKIIAILVITAILIFALTIKRKYKKNNKINFQFIF